MNMNATVAVTVMTTAIAAEDKPKLLKTSFFMDGVFLLRIKFYYCIQVIVMVRFPHHFSSLILFCCIIMKNFI